MNNKLRNLLIDARFYFVEWADIVATTYRRDPVTFTFYSCIWVFMIVMFAIAVLVH